MLRRHLRSWLITVICSVSLICQATLALAGTTGSISGSLVNRATNVPIAGAKVIAASPSQSVTATTDATGHFTFASLGPDTYTISSNVAGFAPIVDAGVLVQSDQNLVISLTASPELRTIGRVASRGASSLVKAGVTADVYSVTPAQQAAAAPLGGGNNLNSAYSAIASMPGTFVPLNDQGGWGQNINLRGGDYTQTGNEIDGIPINRAFDQYSGSPLSNLGNAEIQVYTGNQPADAQANGLAGFINQVIRTGTYPGFTNIEAGVGGPGYYHKFSLETGGATANHNLSYYVGALGYNQSNRFVDQFNGSGVAPIYGSTINYIASGCATPAATVGCYVNGGSANLLGNLPLGPNGYATAPTYWSFIPNIADRETVANVHIGLPHPHDGYKDDIQLMFNTGETYNVPNSSVLDFGSSTADVINGTVTRGGLVIPNSADCPATTNVDVGGTVACAAPVSASYRDQYYYTGPLGTALTAANLGKVTPSFFAGSGTNRALGAAVPLNQVDSETTGFAIGKVQYQHNFGTNAFARVYGYSNYSDRIDNGIQGIYQNYVGAFSGDYLISSHTRGLGLLFADQLDAHNLLSFDSGYTYSNTSRNRNDYVGSLLAASPIAYLVSSANPTAGCYSAAGVLHACSSAARYLLPPVVAGTSAATPQTLVPSVGAPILGTEGGISCGGAPCEYLAVNNGANGALNSVAPAFTNVALSDTFKPNDRLSINAGIRLEDFSYNLQPTNTLGNQLFVNDYNASHCVGGLTVSTRTRGTPCPAGTAPTALSANSPAKRDYAHIFSPRFGATYTLDSNTVVRASYGRFTQPAETSAVDATNLQSGAPSGPFYANFGFASYARSVEPEISYNTDFSFEHAMPQSGLQFKLSPFFRRTTNEFVSILVDPKTNFIANINGLNRKTSGFEFALTKGDFARNGLTAQLAYTYTHATTKFKVFPNGGSFVASSNIAIQNYNAYTKFCATNPTSAQCGATVNGAAASPCYTTTTGAAAAACGLGTVANPYWNAAPQGLLDPNGDYIPYNLNLGPGSSGGATSYIVPHVAAFILSYKKGPLTITPSVQFQAGARYGSPLAVQGVAPDSCGATLGTPLAGDPRYSAGSPGPGSPYNAATCASVIPIPNPQTGHFDGIGEYVQPNLLATNLSVNYDITKRLSVNLIGANLFNRCFGGSKVPWAVGNLGCAYAQAGTYVANVYNPGDVIQPYAAQSYVPNLGGALQSIPAGSPLPFEMYVNFKLRL
jgi:outer membrane receptor protein involved in Fe transport